MAKQRTANQNDWGHVVFREVAMELAFRDFDMRHIKVDINPTEALVKDAMFKPIMQAMYPDKRSTTQLTTEEFNNVMDVFIDALRDRLGIHVTLPEERGRNDY
jgi:hypothetical protein